MHTESRWGDLWEKDHFRDLDVDGKIIKKWIFKKIEGRAWTIFIWLRIGADVGPL